MRWYIPFNEHTYNETATTTTRKKDSILFCIQQYNVYREEVSETPFRLKRKENEKENQIWNLCRFKRGYPFCPFSRYVLKQCEHEHAVE